MKQQRDHLYVRRQQQRPAIRSSLRRVFYARPGSCGPQLVTSRGAATAETTAAAHGEKKQSSKTAKKFPVRSGGSGLGKFGKLGDTSGLLPSPPSQTREYYKDAAAVERKNELDRRPCLPTFMARQPLGPVHIARVSSALCPTMPGNGASRKVKGRWSVPQHSSTGPPHATNGRPHQQHQPPAAPNVSRAQHQLSDSSSSSPGTPLWPATADDPATSGRGGKRRPPYRHDVLDSVVDICPSVSPSKFLWLTFVTFQSEGSKKRRKKHKKHKKHRKHRKHRKSSRKSDEEDDDEDDEEMNEERSEEENNAEELERKLREKALRSLNKARVGSHSCDDSQGSSTAVFVAN
ncbi:hypothetical protein HPB50_009155 [Hyalomma asiaticum]|uniref:Uncharacterized protein n=1 Tax=Hyalomma asiaticum TaxID=266040 RepID=A0ACB7RZN2_HYAAI|nr:hypothetical protein HPB50_009155 [Hyalomma asiaticum]